MPLLQALITATTYSTLVSSPEPNRQQPWRALCPPAPGAGRPLTMPALVDLAAAGLRYLHSITVFLEPSLGLGCLAAHHTRLPHLMPRPTSRIPPPRTPLAPLPLAASPAAWPLPACLAARSPCVLPRSPARWVKPHTRRGDPHLISISMHARWQCALPGCPVACAAAAPASAAGLMAAARCALCVHAHAAAAHRAGARHRCWLPDDPGRLCAHAC